MIDVDYTPTDLLASEIRRNEEGVREMRSGMLPPMFFGWLIGVAVGQLIGVAQGKDLYWHLQGFCNQLVVFFTVILGFLLAGEVFLRVRKRKLRKNMEYMQGVLREEHKGGIID